MSPAAVRRACRLSLAVAAVAGTLTLFAPTHVPAHAQGRPSLEEGRQLYLTGCSSCHGFEGRGTSQGPPLIGVGAAAADFQLSSGRMPMADPRTQARRKPPAYEPEQIEALTRYVASLGEGPEIPRVNPAEGNLVEGNELFIQNCAACHSFAGAGGALGRGMQAPSLYAATPVEIVEAMRTGPGNMPVFGPEALDDHAANSIVRYVLFLRGSEDPGGASLGRIGPLPEGLVAWVVGLGSLLWLTRWIGEREQ